ncbi:5' nucleotidase, NT5C type [Pedobacter punctiformis]|uniref:5'(3')-deoxyribonucleotidase n=1 Tax=Pedobacter punctiformis TaxID=3004097 RepID=A0ABT4L5N6_9SPHI|nr:5'(3')-deoxyribonucleotidase [Pedobacter sp. HCMS5-2]MCZ4243234.1 5'(3')-deoxyribonucleotidase [Pedobacter sp. HCMS5-2]
MKRIAIDMDEVIADVIPKFIKLYNRDYGVPLDLVIEPGNEIYKHVPEHLNQKWFEYINEPGFFRDLAVIADSQRVIKALQEKYDVYIVSAAMEFRNSLTDKYDWLAEHFPFIDWQHIIFCGNKIIEADILIDDRIKNFTTFKGRPLLYTSPHNLLITDYERVSSWQEIEEKLL